MHFFDAKTPKARKEHRCDWCHEAIIKGEQYHYQTVVDGEMLTTRLHIECATALDEAARKEKSRCYWIISRGKRGVCGESEMDALWFD